MCRGKNRKFIEPREKEKRKHIKIFVLVRNSLSAIQDIISEKINIFFCVKKRQGVESFKHHCFADLFFFKMSGSTKE